MKVMIAGAGNVGTFIASDLHAAGHDVLVIEQDPDLVARLRPTLDIEWLAADACEVSSLYTAGMADADVVVSATGDDEDNLVISLLAKQEFAVPRVVARVNHPKNRWLFSEAWGVDVSVSTPHLLTALVEEAVSVGSLVRLLQLEGGRGGWSRSRWQRTRPPPATRSRTWRYLGTRPSSPWSGTPMSWCPGVTPSSIPVTRSWPWSRPTLRMSSDPSSPAGERSRLSRSPRSTGRR